MVTRRRYRFVIYWPQRQLFAVTALVNVIAITLLVQGKEDRPLASAAGPYLCSDSAQSPHLRWEA